ncbi:glutamine amidotransferase-related protein [Candidatus Tremblayella endosymbiont of Pseudococcus viburni]
MQRFSTTVRACSTVCRKASWRHGKLPNSTALSCTWHEGMRMERIGEVMAVRHASLPTQCVQFHPESEFTQYRGAIFANMVSPALVST